MRADSPPSRTQWGLDMTTTTTYGGVITPGGGDDDDPAAYLLAMAQSFDPHLVQQFASKAARNTATASHVAAGKRVVCFVDGGVGLCAHNGSAWVNLNPPVVHRLDHSFGTGAAVPPGGSYTDPTPLSIPAVTNGQVIDLEIQASIRIDGTSRQSILIGATPTNAIQQTQGLVPVLAQQDAAGTGDEYVTYTRKMSFYCDNGTVTLGMNVQCGAGANRLVMNQAQMWAYLYPMDAA